MPSDLDRAYDHADTKDVVVKVETPSSATPATRKDGWRLVKRPLKYFSYGGELKGRLLAPPDAETQVGNAVVCVTWGSDTDLFPIANLPRFRISDDWGTGTASAEEFSRQQRSDDYVELHSALTELSRLTGDEKFDAEIVKDARAVLRKLFYSGIEAPKITWIANEAIVLTWRRRDRVDVLAVTGGGVSLLRDGRFDKALDGIPVCDEDALTHLVQRILK